MFAALGLVEIWQAMGQPLNEHAVMQERNHHSEQGDSCPPCSEPVEQNAGGLPTRVASPNISGGVDKVL